MTVQYATCINVVVLHFVKVKSDVVLNTSIASISADTQRLGSSSMGTKIISIVHPVLALLLPILYIYNYICIYILIDLYINTYIIIYVYININKYFLPVPPLVTTWE